MAWGYSAFGETAIPAGLTDVTAIAAGYGHTVALKRDGTVRSWGFGAFGLTEPPTGLSGVSAIGA